MTARALTLLARFGAEFDNVRDATRADVELYDKVRPVDGRSHARTLLGSRALRSVCAPC